MLRGGCRAGVNRERSDECGVPEPAAGRRPAADRGAHPVGRVWSRPSRTGCGWTRCPTTSRARLRHGDRGRGGSGRGRPAPLADRTRRRVRRPCARWTRRGGSGRCPTRCGTPPTCSAAATCGRPRRSGRWPSCRRRTAGVWCRAVVLGATAAVAGLSAGELARLVGFEDVQTVIAAALKLQPFDPSQGVAWAAAAGWRSRRWWNGSSGLTTHGGDPGARCATDRGVGSAAPRRGAAVVSCLAVPG